MAKPVNISDKDIDLLISIHLRVKYMTMTQVSWLELIENDVVGVDEYDVESFNRLGHVGFISIKGRFPANCRGRQIENIAFCITLAGAEFADQKLKLRRKKSFKEIIDGFNWALISAIAALVAASASIITVILSLHGSK